MKNIDNYYTIGLIYDIGVLNMQNQCWRKQTGHLTQNLLKIETTPPGLLCIWIWTLFTSATRTVSLNWVSMIGCVSSRFHCLFACDHNPPFNYEALATAVAWVSGEIAQKICWARHMLSAWNWSVFPACEDEGLRCNIKDIVKLGIHYSCFFIK